MSLRIAMITLPWKQLPDYPDIGSWKTNADGSPALVATADTGNEISNAAILLHEFIESIWCWQNGVTEEEVTKFDKAWFRRVGTMNLGDSPWGPGDDPKAPYYVGHRIATVFERQFVKENGMTWEQHEKNCESVYEKSPPDIH